MNIQIGDLINFKRSGVLCTIIDSHLHAFTGNIIFKFQSIGCNPLISMIDGKSIMHQIEKNNITHFLIKK